MGKSEFFEIFSSPQLITGILAVVGFEMQRLHSFCPVFDEKGEQKGERKWKILRRVRST